METQEIDINNYELVGIKKKEGVFQTETGLSINFTNYYVEIKKLNTGLVIRAKVDKVFRDYVEEN